MKKIILPLLSLLLTLSSFAEEENKTEVQKIYSQEEFDKKLEEEIGKVTKKIRPENLSLLSQELLKKERELKLAEMELKKREELSGMSEADLVKKYAEFNKEQDKVLACLDKNKNEIKKRVGHMVSVISSMKPVKAAEVLSVQDAEISVQILSELKPEKISKIFNSMDKEISARLQKQYLGMRK